MKKLSVFFLFVFLSCNSKEDRLRQLFKFKDNLDLKDREVLKRQNSEELRILKIVKIDSNLVRDLNSALIVDSVRKEVEVLYKPMYNSIQKSRDSIEREIEIVKYL